MVQRSHLPTPSPTLSNRDAAARQAEADSGSDMDMGTESEVDSLSSADSELARDTDYCASEDELEPPVEGGEDEGRVAVEQLPVPDMPKPADTFATPSELFCAVLKAIMPVYGYRTDDGRVCNFIVRMRQDAVTRRWAIDFEASVLEHSHGADPRIVADPAWRPFVRNPEARAALGLPPFKTEVVSAAAKAAKQDKAAKKRREEAKTERKEAKKDSGKKRPSSATTTSAPPKKPRSSAPPPAPVASATAPAKARNARASLDPSSQQAPKPSTSAPRTTSAPPAPPAVRSASCKPAAPPTQPSASPAPSPATTIPAFLSSLHPSLPALAPHLVSSGFNSPAALVSLTLLEPAILDLTLDLVRLAAAEPKTRPPGAVGPVSVIQLKLLARLLKEAREAM
ncbi:hypothetical protein JCM10450v2_002191 [Rhodotorula kratochvilovae]